MSHDPSDATKFPTPLSPNPANAMGRMNYNAPLSPNPAALGGSGSNRFQQLNTKQQTLSPNPALSGMNGVNLNNNAMNQVNALGTGGVGGIPTSIPNLFPNSIPNSVNSVYGGMPNLLSTTPQLFAMPNPTGQSSNSGAGSTANGGGSNLTATGNGGNA